MRVGDAAGRRGGDHFSSTLEQRFERGPESIAQEHHHPMGLDAGLQ